jgi:hypothetical protein
MQVRSSGRGPGVTGEGNELSFADELTGGHFELGQVSVHKGRFPVPTIQDNRVATVIDKPQQIIRITPIKLAGKFNETIAGRVHRGTNGNGYIVAGVPSWGIVPAGVGPE